MSIEGGCYCGEIRYKAEGDALFKGQCHCRECQYSTGGSPLVIMAMPADGFSYTKGSVGSFSRSDLDAPVTREFCSNCGTQVASMAPSMPGTVMIKVGTLDDPSVFEGPQMAIYTCDAQSWHAIPEGIPSFEKTPG